MGTCRRTSRWPPVPARTSCPSPSWTERPAPRGCRRTEHVRLRRPTAQQTLALRYSSGLGPRPNRDPGNSRAGVFKSAGAAAPASPHRAAGDRRVRQHRLDGVGLLLRPAGRGVGDRREPEHRAARRAPRRSPRPPSTCRRRPPRRRAGTAARPRSRATARRCRRKSRAERHARLRRRAAPRRRELGVVGARHVGEAQADRVVVRPGQRVGPGEVQVILDQHHLARREIRVSAPAALVTTSRSAPEPSSSRTASATSAPLQPS